jgi:hypothetical protein
LSPPVPNPPAARRTRGIDAESLAEWMAGDSPDIA